MLGMIPSLLTGQISWLLGRKWIKLVWLSLAPEIDV